MTAQDLATRTDTGPEVSDQGRAPEGFRVEVVQARRYLTWGTETFFDPRPKRIFAKWIIALGFSVILGLCAAPYSEVVTAPGEIVPTNGIGRVLSPVRGTLADLLVREGDLVKAGQVLAVVTLDLHSSSGASAGGVRLRELLNQISLLEERSRRQRDVDQAAIRKLEQEKQALPERVAVAREVTKQQEQVVGILRAQFQRTSDLNRSGDTTTPQVEKAETDLLRAEVELRDRRDSLRAAMLREAQIKADLNEARGQVLVHEGDIGQQIAELKTKLSDINTEQAVSIIAPFDGIVATVSVNRGSSVAPDRQVLSMIAPTDPLEVDLFVRSDSIGAVEPGMPVSLRLDAFPAHLFGSIPGEVIVVSHALVPPSYLPEWVDRSIPAYYIRARMTGPLVARGKTVVLKPGMTLNGEIVMSVRPLLLRLIDPIGSLITEMTKRYGLRADSSRPSP